jgi:hypothetical protein
MKQRGGPSAAAYVMRRLRIIAAIIAVLVGSQVFQESRPRAAAAPASSPGYVARGDQVESRYRSYRERLERFHDRLAERVKEFGLELSGKLEAAAPQPIPHGYQILPRFAADMAPPAKKPRATSTGFSWPRTERLIDQGSTVLAGLEGQLEETSAQPGAERRGAYEKLVDAFRRLSDGRKLIDSTVQYNRLWQFNIAELKAEYDRQTRLHDAVLERQAMADALAAQDDAAFRAALRDIKGIDQNGARVELEGDLRAREKNLADEIERAAGALTTPGFVRVEHGEGRRWTLRVPMYTDIEDTEFVGAFKDAVEKTWRVRDGNEEFQVEIAFATLAPARLYGPAAPPQKGAHIDVAKHIGLFPQDGASLTTGAVTTHVFGRAIVLGPHDIAPHVLAHEFGHLLGFRDFYFRGYEDLGGDGYLVKEAIADPNDIMGAPGYGPVLRRHFEKIIESSTGNRSSR